LASLVGNEESHNAIQNEIDSESYECDKIANRHQPAEEAQKEPQIVVFSEPARPVGAVPDFEVDKDGHEGYGYAGPVIGNCQIEECLDEFHAAVLLFRILHIPL
jgi:hypothetical protein